MKFFSIILLFLTVTAALSGAETPGLAAYREQNYGGAARLLSGEIVQFEKGSKEYFEHIFAYIDSLLYCNRSSEAEQKFKQYKKEVSAEAKNLFDLLEAKFAYVNKDLKSCEKILQGLKDNSDLPPVLRFDIVVLFSEIYLADGRSAEAVELLDSALKDENIVKNGEFTLKSLLLRALAAAGNLNRIPAEYEALKKKYPEMQGKLQHFELLIYAINQDLAAYRKLFTEIFPDENPLAALIGDMVLYQGALLGEQQAQKEKNIPEIAFHLKNQTWFAPNDEYRAGSYRNLIELYLANNDKKYALKTVRSMLDNVKELADSIKWKMIYARLQNELNDGDAGLAVYLDIKNNPDAAAEIRAEAAENAAGIYKKANKNADMLKLYAFMADFPDNRKVSDRGSLLAGKYYFEHGESRMSESLLSKIMPDSESYPEALFYLVQCRIANGEYSAAAVDIRKLDALKNSEKNIDLPEFELASVYFRAVIAEALKKDDDAAALYEKAARTASVRTAALPMLANAWLKAAELQLKRHSYSDAGLLFLTFAEKYPRHKDTAAALYKSVYAYFLADRRDEMKYGISKLQKDFPAHELTVNALFHETDYLRGKDMLQESLKTLDVINTLNNNRNQNITAQVCYDKALTFYQLRRYDSAMDELKKIASLSNTSCFAEGLFLAGSIASEQGKNAESSEYFLKAASARNELLFSASARGRAADNYFIEGTKNKNLAALKTASEIYAGAVKNTKLAITFRLQCYYKLGRTLEAMQDYQGALDAYTEALYLNYSENEVGNNAVIPVWVNRSALNAIDIHLRQGGSNALNDAVFIIRRLKKLNTMTAKELEDLEYNVRSRYMRND